MSRELPAHPTWPDGSPMLISQTVRIKDSDDIPESWRVGRIIEMRVVGLTARDGRDLDLWIHTDMAGSLIIHAEDIELVE